MRDLECDPRTLAGPVDPRVVAKISQQYPLDPDYLACMEACHGGIPSIGAVEFGSYQSQVGLFLTLLDEKSILPGPFRPHFEIRDMDKRVVNSISYLMDYEHMTSMALFDGLVPFAATLAGMCLDRAYVDLFCFNYRGDCIRPPVVLWRASRALSAYMEWENLPEGDRFDDDGIFNSTSIPWDSFLLPVAESFADLVTSLQPIAPHQASQGG